jgi:epoxide hydrolase-like predicted phosphatase
MTIRAVCFDLGGVILRTEHEAPREHLAERLNMTYEDLCQVVFDSESARRAAIGQITKDEHWSRVLKRLGAPASDGKAVWDEFFGGDIIDRDLLTFIGGLRPKYKTGLISNGWLDLHEYVAQTGIEAAFDAVVISAEVGVTKPSPEIYRLALERLGARPEESIFVDDVPANVEGASALGIHGIVFRDTEQVKREVGQLLR